MSSSSNKKRGHDDDDRPRSTGVDYNAVMDRQVGDKRFEREKQYKEQTISTNGTDKRTTVSSTFDAFQRMAAGLEGRTLADKIADPNRPTWEQYKKENEEKLDMAGEEVRKMVEYRAQLDKERDRRLKQLASGSSRSNKSDDTDSTDSSDSADDDSSSDSNKKSRSKKHKKEKKSKKHKKHKKEHKKSSKKERRKHSENSGSDAESGGDGAMRLSDFLKGKCD